MVIMLVRVIQNVWNFNAVSLILFEKTHFIKTSWNNNQEAGANVNKNGNEGVTRIVKLKIL